MTLRALVGLTVLCMLAALGSGTVAAQGFHDAVPIEAPGFARCTWTGRYKPPVVYTESDFIRGYFEPTDLASYRKAMPAMFEMPPRPMLRVTFLDFYRMENGPIYLESEISVLALHDGQPGWFVLTMPVTDGDACAGGRFALGTPKIMRRITFERGADQYVGTSYARSGRSPEFKMSMDVGEPGEPALEVLRFVYPFPDYYLQGDRVVKAGGLRTSADRLEASAPGIWKVRLGQARLEYSQERESLLHRLGVGQPLAAYWAQLRFRYSITPR